MKKILLLIAVLAVGTLTAQDTNYMRQVLRELTSERFHGRGYSYRGDSIAANYIRGELRRLGVKPLTPSFFQDYTFSVFSMEGPLDFAVNGKRLKAYSQYRVPAWSKSTWGDYKVLTLPPETIVDAAKLKAFLRKNNDKLEDVFIYIDASNTEKLSEAEKKLFNNTIAGLQRRNPFNSRGVMVGMEQLNTYSPANTNYEHGYAYVEVLAAEMPKKVKHVNCHIFTQFHPAYKTQNIYGYVPGEVDTMIVFTAHYDHLGTMGDSVTFYGAHDNGSGVAAVMDMARMAVFEHPHYTMVYCFFSGEEAGLQGSKYAVEHPLFDFDKVRLLVNIDMFCGGDEGLMVFNADVPETQPFIERLETLNSALEVTPEIRRRKNRPNSDHWYFSQHVPTLYILTMGQRYGGYHDPDDTCDRCGLENYMNFITLISSLTF